MYVCEPTPQHLYPTADRSERNISKIKATFNVYTQEQVTASPRPGVDWGRVLSQPISSSLCGHVTHLQLPLEMRHTADIKISLSGSLED